MEKRTNGRKEQNLFKDLAKATEEVSKQSEMKAPVTSHCYLEAVQECFAQQHILTDLEVGWAANAFSHQSREGPACERKQVIALLGHAGA